METTAHSVIRYRGIYNADGNNSDGFINPQFATSLLPSLGFRFSLECNYL